MPETPENTVTDFVNGRNFYEPPVIARVRVYARHRSGCRHVVKGGPVEAAHWLSSSPFRATLPESALENGSGVYHTE